MSQRRKVSSKSPAVAEMRYPFCKRLGQAEDTNAYNDLITNRTGIESATAIPPNPVQGDMFQ